MSELAQLAAAAARVCAERRDCVSLTAEAPVTKNHSRLFSVSFDLGVPLGDGLRTRAGTDLRGPVWL